MNEYLQEFRELEKRSFRGQQWFGERQHLVEKYGWAIPNDEVIEYLSQFNYITEVGAGKGYWASLIEERGGRVDCSDIEPPEDTYTQVDRGNIVGRRSKITDYPTLIIWPPYNEVMSKQVIDYQPSNLIYVGEPRGGCTATDEFFDTLDELYGLVKEIDIPSYEGVNDNCYHYIRKT